MDNGTAMLRALGRAYPDAPKTMLRHQTTFQLLVATMLSAQCTDASVNRVTDRLFRTHRKPVDYASAPLRELEALVRSTGFYRNKARNIKAASRMILDEYSGRVPDTMDALVRLPGVARKTANIVLTNGYGRVEGIAVDTHVKRLAKRMGLTAHDDPVKIERDLMSVLPMTEWPNVNRLLVTHGRAVCAARKPRCGTCAIGRICPKKGV